MEADLAFSWYLESPGLVYASCSQMALFTDMSQRHC